MNMKNELEMLKCQVGLLRKLPCSESENEQYELYRKYNEPLPEGVFYDSQTSGFYTIANSELSEDEVKLYIDCKALSLLTTIKKCVVFFTVLTVISLICGAILFLDIIAEFS